MNTVLNDQLIQTASLTSNNSMNIEETAAALGLFPSSIHRTINYLKSGGTLLSNMDIDFENGCFRKVG
jgi:hypothetical protein